MSLTEVRKKYTDMQVLLDKIKKNPQKKNYPDKIREYNRINRAMLQATRKIEKDVTVEGNEDFLQWLEETIQDLENFENQLSVLQIIDPIEKSTKNKSTKSKKSTKIPAPEYTDDYLLDSVNEYYYTYGHMPKMTDMPLGSTLKRRFGSWSEVIRLSGIPREKRQKT